MIGDLTTVANVASWLGTDKVNAANTPLIQRLITMASRFILGQINRQDLTYHQVSETRDGLGGNVLLLPEYPVISVVSLAIDGVPIQQQTIPGGPGFTFDAWTGEDTGSVQKIVLSSGRGGFMPGYGVPFGYGGDLGYGGGYGALGSSGRQGGFPRRQQCIQVVYMAGFYIAAEAWTVPAGSPPQIQPYRLLAEDQGVVNAETLAPLTFVPPTAPGTPPTLTVGQYSADQTTGLYTFAEADVGAALTGSYSYTPEDLSQACVELVGERFTAKSRIGLISQSLGGQETVSYSQKDMGAFIESLIDPYRKSIPL
jgi:hypothetical protein